MWKVVAGCTVVNAAPGEEECHWSFPVSALRAYARGVGEEGGGSLC